MISRKTIQNYSWYRQGCDISLFFAESPLFMCFTYLGEDTSCAAIQGKQGNFYWPIEKLWPKIKNVYARQKKDRRCIDRYIARWVSIKDKKEKYMNSLSLNGISKEEVRKIIEKYHSIDRKLWLSAFYPELFDAVDEHSMLTELARYSVYMNTHDFKTLLQPVEPSSTQLVELKIMQASKESMTNIKKRAELLARKYFFIHNDWEHSEILGSNYFLRKIMKFTKLKKSELESKMVFVKNYKRNRNRENREIIKKYKIPKEMSNLFYFFQRLSVFRDLRKLHMQKHIHFMDALACKVSKLTGMKHEEVVCVFSFEIKTLLQENDLSQYRRKIKIRKDWVLLMSKRGVPEIYSGMTAKKAICSLRSHFHSQFNEIRGTTGNKGCATGTVKVLWGKKDFHKFNKGDIIVAPMTRPEYLPLMEKASAIITDEGGVTCHAAIVSREMGKPCIIGTHVATEMLKDGETVEVDANKGIIKVLK